MTDSTRQFVLRLVGKKARLPKDVDIDSFNYIDSGYIDSIELIHFVVEIESEFDIEIAEADMDSLEFKTVGGLVSIIEKKVAPRG